MGTSSGEIDACVGIGSNLGDRSEHISRAIQELAAIPGVRVIRVSSIIETEPAGPIPQGKYLNAAALLGTCLAPRAMLEALLEVERLHGRNRRDEARWGPRRLDLDLLLYGDQVLREPGLVVPHPRLHERLFVLGPLSEIAAGMKVPPSGRTVGELFTSLVEQSSQMEGKTF